MAADSLESACVALAGRGGGILAADESPSTLAKRFASTEELQGLQCDEEGRRAYRELLLTSNLAANNINGVILHEETLRQATKGGKSFVDCLKDQGVLAGVKVDKGLKPMQNSSLETETKGLEDLPERCAMYRAQGARFTKWRAALKVSSDGETMPSKEAVERNAMQLASYARVCQDSGLVPIVEPEILVDGDYSRDVAKRVASRVLSAVFRALDQENVALEHCLLKPQMVVSGISNPENGAIKPMDVASDTLEVFRSVIPPSVRAVVFLSGGQSEAQASVNLNAINVMARSGDIENFHALWPLSFSFGRALQASVLRIWAGKDKNVAEAQRQLELTAKANGLASLGQYNPPHPSQITKQGSNTLVENFRGWNSSA
mmetsp:Transcript_3829/g.9713  ORF Transcript_3829/g.9713 Transcript_3829/m.9713 type:complete len:376 (+) Transcript_3829:207-1334(+)|eukprot:CAMPEP_0198243748 /NCGR_PEP_ID=MMETSP1446-20131203/30541_1 /TAXON_ID=1461542 ORGANISM="Unidentified sp, Strain CCMP2111" /NCGR_SAMPLE_ID=MMETSP1446 /ASSEMBLY_ACC=CAM_ASM_001112 /LENGTH=375 /DNA_ID=CAMNT_0043927667 /DNA_START=143 /DNA_END=1270 /DNA_ORIENTATION=-